MIYIKQLLIKRSVVFTIGFLLSFVSLGFSQNINGVTTANLNTTHVYTFDDGQLHTPNWNVTNGTLISTAQPTNGSTTTSYSAIIKWDISGSSSVNFSSLATLNVSIATAGTNNTLLSNLNYVHTVVPRIATTNVSQLTNDEKIETVTYFDGLGRPNQSISIRAGNKNDDILNHIEYDDYGRQLKEFLPVAIILNGGAYNYSALVQTNSFYNTPKYENTTNPFSEKAMEASPLSRVLKQAAPGYDWRMDGGHEIEMNYLTNTTNEVRHYEVNLNFANNTYTPTLVLNGYYNAGELYKSIIKDENHDGSSTKAHTTEEFKDIEGRVILKRTYGTSKVNGTVQVNVAHDTYYTYDIYGNLTYVLPPKSEAQEAMPNTTTLEELCYQYKYDYRNRLVEKKIPGKGWEYIVYNKIDQPIMTQDTNLKNQGKWLVTKYDAYNRVTYTAIKNSSSSRINFQNTFDADPSYTPQFESRASGTGYMNTYYTSAARPTSVNEILTINYYDDYTFDLDSGISQNAYGVTPITNVKGLATGNKVRVLDTDKWITSVAYYDVKARPIYNYSKNNYLETVDMLFNQLEFDSRITETLTIHDKTGNSSIKIIDEFSYDTSNRLKSHTQSIDGGPTEVIVENKFDELGQLEAKGVGGKTNTNRLQIVDFTYNIRGWLKTINDPAILGDDLFSFKLNYNTKEIGGDASYVNLYNGNISETIWKTAYDASSNKTRGYAYAYDALNRITKSDYGIKTTGSFNIYQGYEERVPNYDKNGNILNLVRYKTPDALMDNLSYTYSGNKLIKVVENATSSINDEGFKDGTNSGDDYNYDANGNMVKDNNKGISTIVYNHLNLPTKVNLPAGDIDYVYDATGVKLKKFVTKGATTEYAGMFVYEDSKLRFFSQPEGYVEPEKASKKGQTYNYVYQYKDHLGNIRLSYEDSNDNGSIDNTSEIREENNYYPFGLKHKGYNENISPFVNGVASKFKYNGIELEEAFDLNLYEMDWRSYDPTIARFTSIDPVVHYQYSTYSAFDNNPIFWADPSGADSENSQASTYIDPSGKVIDHIDDDDNNVYLVSDVKNWDGTKNGLTVAGKEDPSRNYRKGDKYNYYDDFIGYNFGGLGTNLDMADLVTSELKIAATVTVIPIHDESGRVIGMWRTFKKVPFKALKYVNGVLKPLGILTTGLNFGVNTYQVATGQMSVGRYSYNTLGTVGSMYASSAYGGPVGVAVGTIVYVGDMFIQANEASNAQAKSAYETSRFKLGPNPNSDKSIFTKDFWNSLNPRRYLNPGSFFEGFKY